jgi:hypothetical protein
MLDDPLVFLGIDKTVGYLCAFAMYRWTCHQAGSRLGSAGFGAHGGALFGSGRRLEGCLLGSAKESTGMGSTTMIAKSQDQTQQLRNLDLCRGIKKIEVVEELEKFKRTKKFATISALLEATSTTHRKIR